MMPKVLYGYLGDERCGIAAAGGQWLELLGAKRFNWFRLFNQELFEIPGHNGVPPFLFLFDNALTHGSDIRVRTGLYHTE